VERLSSFKARFSRKATRRPGANTISDVVGAALKIYNDGVKEISLISVINQLIAWRWAGEGGKLFYTRWQ
jgi:hypothetical protein